MDIFNTLGFQLDNPNINTNLRLTYYAFLFALSKSQLKIFDGSVQQLMREYKSAQEKKEMGVQLKMKVGQWGHWWYSVTIHMKLLFLENISKAIIIGMFAYAMANKSAVGVVYLFMVEIVLIVERQKRWQFVWIPAVTLSLLGFILQYLSVTHLLSINEDLLNWLGFK